jgi:arylsulfatase A-like enzyme
VRVPDVMQGESLSPLLRGESVPWREEFLYEHRINIRTIPKSEGVRTKHWKYVRYTESEPLVEQLFDLEHDPLEEHDLTRDAGQAEQVERMREKWRDLGRRAE